mgnify:CR=1 FL=1
MNQTLATKPIDTQALAEQAKAAPHKETYKLLQKNRVYRIGAGARAAPNGTLPCFFLEALINLSSSSGEVDLSLLEKVLSCLKTLHQRGYLLAYEDGNTISCEKRAIANLNEEYQTLQALLKTTLT